MTIETFFLRGNVAIPVGNVSRSSFDGPDILVLPDAARGIRKPRACLSTLQLYILKKRMHSKSIDDLLSMIVANCCCVTDSCTCNDCSRENLVIFFLQNSKIHFL